MNSRLQKPEQNVSLPPVGEALALCSFMKGAQE